jgi:hypothetical protein
VIELTGARVETLGVSTGAVEGWQERINNNATITTMPRMINQYFLPIIHSLIISVDQVLLTHLIQQFRN